MKPKKPTGLPWESEWEWSNRELARVAESIRQRQEYIDQFCQSQKLKYNDFVPTDPILQSLRRSCIELHNFRISLLIKRQHAERRK